MDTVHGYHVILSAREESEEMRQGEVYLVRLLVLTALFFPAALI